MKNKVREKARLVVEGAHTSGVRITFAEAFGRLVDLLRYSDVPPHEYLANTYIAAVLRSELHRKGSDGVQDFLSVNDTTVWNDARTYVPTQIATIENLRRDLELSRLLEAQAVARVQLRDRAVEIYEENDGALSVEECLRMAAEEEDAPGIATVA